MGEQRTIFHCYCEKENKMEMMTAFHITAEIYKLQTFHTNILMINRTMTFELQQ